MRWRFTLVDLFVLIGMVAVLLWMLGAEGKAGGCGRASVRLDFEIVDAAGQPIPNAVVELDVPDGTHARMPVTTPRGGGGVFTTAGERHTLVCDKSGQVSESTQKVFFDFNERFRWGKVVRRSHIYSLPQWRFRATAPGYEPSDWEELSTFERRKSPIFVPKGGTYLPLRISLRPVARGG